MPVYPLTPNPDDILEAMRQEHENLMFADVHVRGEYPGYAKRYFREKEPTEHHRMRIEKF